jgi:pimeloyl-ACP methyl ester carboxylesterase
MVSNFGVDSTKPPLVLFHGLAMSGNAWREVVPLVSGHHRVYAPTADGHRGGSAAQRRRTTMTDMVDAAERYLDECGLDRPHLAGNSMGGFVAIELARRGRAASVCAFSRGLLDGSRRIPTSSIRQVATRRGDRSPLASGPSSRLPVR